MPNGKNNTLDRHATYMVNDWLGKVAGVSLMLQHALALDVIQVLDDS